MKHLNGRSLAAVTLSLALFTDATAADIVAGKAIARKCEHCHAIGPTGASQNASSPPFRELNKRYPLENLQEALAEGIVVGHDNDMPAFRLHPAEIENFLAYLQSIQAK